MQTEARTDIAPSELELLPDRRLTRSTIALVLAGGRGSRLGPLTDWRAKPAVPFGGKFRIIDFALSNCVNSGVRRIGILTQYKAQSLIRHIQNGWGFLDGRLGEFVELMPAQQRTWTADTVGANERSSAPEWYRGTADAVFQNLDILRRHDPRLVLVLAGDHVYKMDYARILADHVRRGADMTVGCIEAPLEEARSFGVMAVDASLRVQRFDEKPEQPKHMPGRPDLALASMGIYVFNAPFLFEQLTRDANDPDSDHDFGKDIIPYLLSRGHGVFAHGFSDSCVTTDGGPPYWRDVGTVDAYWEANMELVKITPALNLYDRDWPVWTFQVQLPPAKFVFDDDERRGMAIDSMVSGGCLISGSCLRRTLLFSGVRVHSYCTIEDSVILPNVVVERHVVLKRVVIDRGCRIPAGTKIGVDAAADRERFHVTDKGVVLVTPEMLGQNVHHRR
jgi:glucose-1-phosphate adenylyltransferase